MKLDTDLTDLSFHEAELDVWNFGEVFQYKIVEKVLNQELLDQTKITCLKQLHKLNFQMLSLFINSKAWQFSERNFSSCYLYIFVTTEVFGDSVLC